MLPLVRFRINLIISVVILAGFISVGLTSYNTYSRIIRQDIENISRLAATNIFSNIESELTKPIFVSLTMANDTFLKKWLEEEGRGNLSDSHLMELTEYLSGIRNKYGYSSVFLVSEATGRYYYYDGLNKTISRQDDHDIWYYRFIESGSIYKLDVDTDEVNQNNLSVFINCRITNVNEMLMGVTGVGLRIDEVQKLMSEYEQAYQLDVLLFGRDGEVQIHTDNSEVKPGNVFVKGPLVGKMEQILQAHEDIRVFRYHENNSDGYLITRYVDVLDWYLLVEKDTSVLTRSFRNQMLRDLLIFLAVIVAVLLFVNRLITTHQKALGRMAGTDHLTGLPNRRGFNESIMEAMHGQEAQQGIYIFVLDIDNFKKVNDIHGHLAGDEIIASIGLTASKSLGNAGKIFRWGGDEFAGFIFGEEKDIKAVVEKLFIDIHDTTILSEFGITISLGVTNATGIDKPDTALYRADKGLYTAKENGKDRYVLI